MSAVQQEISVPLLCFLRGFVNLMVQILDSFQNPQQWVSFTKIADFWDLSREHKLLCLTVVFACRWQHLQLGISSLSSWQGEKSRPPTSICLMNSSPGDPFQVSHKDSAEPTWAHGGESCHRPAQNIKSPQKANCYHQGQVWSSWSSNWIHTHKQEGNLTVG